MSIDIPTLDDIEYAELVEDARKRIPVYAETWTDHNASDPGITILELLAWIAETYSYQLDRITDAHRLKYLKLLGEKPRPPRPAAVDLRVRPEDGIPVVPERTKLVAATEDGAIHEFETTERIVLTWAAVDRVITDERRGRLDNTKANETPGMQFLAFGESAVEGNALYLGFREDPFDTNCATFTGPSRPLSIRVTLDERGLPEPATHGVAAGTEEPVTFEPTVELEWQYCLDYGEWYRDENWAPLTVVADGTNRLYRSGTVKLEAPANWLEGATDRVGEVRPILHLEEDETYYWIRCVVRTGGYEVPPPLESVAVNVVPAEQRWTVETDAEDCEREGSCRCAGSDQECHCRFARVRDSNTNLDTRSGRCEPRSRECARERDRPGTGASPLRNADGESTSTGQPRQVFKFDRRPILEASVSVDGEPWHERDDFDASTPQSPHYVLDREDGEVRFGDGLRGKIPPPGAIISASEYVIGGGSAGNVSESAIWAFADHDEIPRGGPCGCVERTLRELTGEVTAVGPATGGADAESIDATFDRLVEDREIPYRAVSLEDYEHVATHTPGLRFGRATARAVDAKVDDCEPHREVRVIVVPHGTSDEPVPSEGFREAVEEHLEDHRLLTDHVTVEGPSYVQIGVDAKVRVDPNAALGDATGTIEDALNRFLDPLHGFEGKGWPFGRPLYRSELYEAIEEVTGVESVIELGVRPQNEQRVTDDGTVLIPDTALLSPDEHFIEVESGARDALVSGGR